ncbi:hypothetical protein Cni_G13196 [Canna indica]|uniref:DUF6821 domain-containing protein n=1 Tax=Canna indica TaxID=4628 RepID=A0AAQ3KBD1_9LILI|nr:hypothetical protein Cni_G13196 [Canna indica]
MEGHADFHDWEILLGSDSGEDPKPLQASSEDDSEDGAIKFDYFALESLNRNQKGAAFGGSTHEEEVQVDSDNPSWVDPESDSRFVERTKGEVDFPGIEFPHKVLSGVWSDESSEGQRSHIGSEKGRTDMNEEDEKVVDVEGPGDIDEGSGEHVNLEDSAVELGDKNIGLEKVLDSRGENKRGTVWWKFPFELLKFCAFRVKPVWSISIAAAILGVLMLGKRLYSMKQKARIIPLKLILDEKKASQLKTHAARLNEAFSVVSRSPIVRASLPAGGLTPWSVVSLQ